MTQPLDLEGAPDIRPLSHEKCVFLHLSYYKFSDHWEVSYVDESIAEPYSQVSLPGR